MEASKPRILVVEDNKDTRLLLRYMLKDRFQLSMASNVDDALAAAEGATFALLLLDINLGSRRTGVNLLEHLRDQPEHASTPALALTAYALPGDRDRFLDAGFDGYVSKPFQRKELLSTIDTILQSSTA